MRFVLQFNMADTSDSGPPPNSDKPFAVDENDWISKELKKLQKTSEGTSLKAFRIFFTSLERNYAYSKRFMNEDESKFIQDGM